MYSTYDYSNTTAQVSPSINELLCHRECFITQLPSADTQQTHYNSARHKTPSQDYPKPWDIIILLSISQLWQHLRMELYKKLQHLLAWQVKVRR